MNNNFIINEILRRFSDPIRMVIRGYFNNKMDADDVYQNVTIHIMNKIKLIEQDSDLEIKLKSKPYIIRATKNFCIDIKRKQTRNQKKFYEDDSVFETKTPIQNENDIFKNFKTVNIEKALIQLKERDRQLIALRYYKQKSIKDIDTILGITNSSVYIDRAEAKLKKILAVGKLPDDFDGFIIED